MLHYLGNICSTWKSLRVAWDTSLLWTFFCGSLRLHRVKASELRGTGLFFTSSGLNKL